MHSTYADSCSGSRNKSAADTQASVHPEQQHPEHSLFFLEFFYGPELI